ncbi:hypothetical protein OHA38_14665 [Streptomyces sp. NBC_01732]|uniref:hypothetical protein n=1 Tax=Streptomyces sp. NBC_01732 TaxID=2975926 RepID=UPI00352E5DB7|nr:hypothetical protein OHA38_14665 [Streptomyces sp. NBC_01732]
MALGSVSCEPDPERAIANEAIDNEQLAKADERRLRDVIQDVCDSDRKFQDEHDLDGDRSALRPGIRTAHPPIQPPDRSALKRTTFMAAAIVAGGLALTACGPQEPKLPELAGKNFATAYKAADKAGYKLIHAMVPTSTPFDGDNDLATAPENMPKEYENWTACWHEATYVDVGDDPFWSIDFYLVAKKSDCKDGRLNSKKQDAYDELVKEASKDEGTTGADEDSQDGEEDSSASCYSPTWGNFSCDTGLPAPDERNSDGSYKYAICDEGEEAYNAGCYPYYDELQRWQDTHSY